MEAVKILEKPTTVTWDYDEEADVLYLSIGEPQPAVGMDIGEGVSLRYESPQRSRGTYLDRVAGTAAEGPGWQPLNARCQ